MCDIWNLLLKSATSDCMYSEFSLADRPSPQALYKYILPPQHIFPSILNLLWGQNLLFFFSSSSASTVTVWPQNRQEQEKPLCIYLIVFNSLKQAATTHIFLLDFDQPFLCCSNPCFKWRHPFFFCCFSSFWIKSDNKSVFLKPVGTPCLYTLSVTCTSARTFSLWWQKTPSPSLLWKRDVGRERVLARCVCVGGGGLNGTS